MVLATQNPVEYLGTFPLPEAQLDRFFLKVSIGYPSPEDESEMLARFRTNNPIATLRPVASAQDIMEIQTRVTQVHVDASLSDYIVALVGETRQNANLVLGASPRVSLGLYRAAQAYAFYQGRTYVTPDDIQQMAIPVMAHRIVLKQEVKLKHMTAEDVVREVVSRVSVPVARNA